MDASKLAGLGVGGGGGGGARDATPGINFFSISCSFLEILAKSLRVAAPTLGYPGSANGLWEGWAVGTVAYKFSFQLCTPIFLYSAS